MLEAGDLVSPGRSSEEELPVVVVVVVVVVVLMGWRDVDGEVGEVGEEGETGVEERWRRERVRLRLRRDFISSDGIVLVAWSVVMKRKEKGSSAANFISTNGQLSPQTLLGRPPTVFYHDKFSIGLVLPVYYINKAMCEAKALPFAWQLERSSVMPDRGMQNIDGAPLGSLAT